MLTNVWIIFKDFWVPLSKLSHSSYQVKGSREGLFFQGKKQSVTGQMRVSGLEAQPAEAPAKARELFVGSGAITSTIHSM